MSTTTLTLAGQILLDPEFSGLGPVQDHVRRLREDGGSYRAIAAAAGLAPTTIQDLVSGRRPATPYTATALLAVTSETVPRYRLDTGGTRLRLRALHVMGHGSARIARAVGIQKMTIAKIVRGDTTTISPQLRDAITAVYDAWWDKRAPARTRWERGAATAARKRAIAGNWCAPAALDDDLLDIPGYQPRCGWKPATGTGAAPDINPPVLQQQRSGDDERQTLHLGIHHRGPRRHGTPRLPPQRQPPHRAGHRTYP
jgi:plasmid maintenance system antidote protein VapI